MSPGLPPQVRGAPRKPPTDSAGRRLTPAGAGSTAVHWLTASPQRAYPRRCGEHGCPVDLAVHNPGLPPQVRGAHVTADHRLIISWLTPAGAGSTQLVVVGFDVWWAYPRRCGEHLHVSEQDVAH